MTPWTPPPRQVLTLVFLTTMVAINWFIGSLVMAWVGVAGAVVLARSIQRRMERTNG